MNINPSDAPTTLQEVPPNSAKPCAALAEKSVITAEDLDMEPRVRTDQDCIDCD